MISSPFLIWSLGTLEVGHDGLVIGFSVSLVFAPHNVLVTVVDPCHFDCAADSLS